LLNNDLIIYISIYTVKYTVIKFCTTQSFNASSPKNSVKTPILRCADPTPGVPTLLSDGTPAVR
jgi:hypothetical protein